MDVSPQMYTKLFNAITDARKLVDEAMEILSNAQIEAEEIYISKEDTK